MAPLSSKPRVALQPDDLPDSALAFGLEPRWVRAEFPTDYDIGRVYRLISAAGLAGAVIALHGTFTEPALRPRERRVAAAAGAVYLTLSLVGVWAAPSRVARWFQRRPRRALLGAIAPLLLVAPSGGARTPLYRLATIGVGTAGGVRERARDAQLQALIAGAVWTASVVATPDMRHARWRDHLNVTVGFVIASRIAATASQVAYDSRNLFDQLFEFTYERQELDAYAMRLRVALLEMRNTLVQVLAATPRDGVDRHELFDEVIAALGRLEERLGVLDIASDTKFDLERQLQAIRPMITDSQALDALMAESGVGPQELRSMLVQRARVFTDLAARPLVPSVIVDEGVEVRGLRRLALIGATVTAATTNAVRHAADMTYLRIHVSRNGDDIALEITNDGTPATTAGQEPRPRSGLTHLRRQIEEFGNTTPVFTPLHGGGYSVRIVLPAESEASQLEFWADEIRWQIDEGLTKSTRFAAIKSTVTAISPRPRGAGASTARLAAPLHALLPATAEILNASGRLRGRSVDLEAIVLILAAQLNYLAARRGGGLLTTWVNGFASRYAFHASPDAWTGWRPASIARAAVTARSQQRAYGLAALNVAALFLGFRGSADKSWDRDIASTGLGPLLMCAIVNPALPRSRLLDRAINERLVEVESLHDLADSFHSDHPATPKILDLANLLADDGLSERLRDGLAAIDAAEDELISERRTEYQPVASSEPLARLGAWMKREGSPFRDSRLVQRIWPAPRGQYRPSVALPNEVKLGEYLARALARRVWPARIRLEFDAETLGFAPRAAIHSAAFRRQAVAAMDIAARELNREFGRGLDGMWLLRQVDLQLSVVPHTGTIECRIVPWAPTPARWRQAVDSLHDLIARVPYSGTKEDRQADVQRLLAQVNASLVAWTIFPMSELDRSDVIHPPATRKPYPSVRRGDIRLQMHPQRFSPERIDLARHLDRSAKSI